MINMENNKKNIKKINEATLRGVIYEKVLKELDEMASKAKPVNESVGMRPKVIGYDYETAQKVLNGEITGDIYFREGPEILRVTEIHDSQDERYSKYIPKGFISATYDNGNTDPKYLSSSTMSGLKPNDLFMVLY